MNTIYISSTYDFFYFPCHFLIFFLFSSLCYFLCLLFEFRLFYGGMPFIVRVFCLFSFYRLTWNQIKRVTDSLNAVLLVLDVSNDTELNVSQENLLFAFAKIPLNNMCENATWFRPRIFTKFKKKMYVY